MAAGVGRIASLVGAGMLLVLLVGGVARSQNAPPAGASAGTAALVGKAETKAAFSGVDKDAGNHMQHDAKPEVHDAQQGQVATQNMHDASEGEMAKRHDAPAKDRGYRGSVAQPATPSGLPDSGRVAVSSGDVGWWYAVISIASSIVAVIIALLCVYEIMSVKKTLSAITKDNLKLHDSIAVLDFDRNITREGGECLVEMQDNGSLSERVHELCRDFFRQNTNEHNFIAAMEKPWPAFAGVLERVFKEPGYDAIAATEPAIDILCRYASLWRQRIDRLENRLNARPLSDAKREQGLAVPDCHGEEGVDAGGLLRALRSVEREMIVKDWHDLYTSKQYAMEACIDRAMHTDKFTDKQDIESVIALSDSVSTIHGLGSDIERLIRPVRQFYNATQQMRLCSKYKNNPEIGHVNGTLRQLRGASTFLALLRHFDKARDVFDFDFKTWMHTEFILLADLFYCEYQRGRQHNKAQGLESPRQLVDGLLASMDLKILDIVLDRTLFDSRFHLARSTSSDASLAEGVVTGMIKNGFVSLDGGLVRQAEVVVNRA